VLARDSGSSLAILPCFAIAMTTVATFFANQADESISSSILLISANVQPTSQ
jgi:hypothetical protein